MLPPLLSRPSASLAAIAVLLLAPAGASPALAQEAAAADHAAATPDNAVLLTIFLKHDETRPLAELDAQLERQGFFKAFPPPGVEVVSWYVAMGIGQVVTLRLPASRIREVNRVIEDTAWGVFQTEFFPTYNYKEIGIGLHDKAK